MEGGRLHELAKLMYHIDVSQGRPTLTNLEHMVKHCKAFWLQASWLTRPRWALMRMDAKDDRFNQVFHFKQRTHAKSRFEELAEELKLPSLKVLMTRTRAVVKDEDIVHLLNSKSKGAKNNSRGQFHICIEGDDDYEAAGQGGCAHCEGALTEMATRINMVAENLLRVVNAERLTSRNPP